MPETYQNWLGLVDIYYARQAREIYQVLPYLVDLKAPVEQYLVNVVLF